VIFVWTWPHLEGKSVITQQKTAREDRMLRFALLWIVIFFPAYVIGGTILLILFDWVPVAPKGFPAVWGCLAAAFALVGAHEIYTRR
jgi:hypothetical protein